MSAREFDWMIGGYTGDPKKAARELTPAELKLAKASAEMAVALEAFVAVHVEDGTCGPESSSKAEDPSQEWCGWCGAAREALRNAGRLS